MEPCDAERCGCASARSEIEHVRVIELQPGEETHNQGSCRQCEDYGPDGATVKVVVICEHKNGGEEDDQVTLQWHLIREDDRWKLDSAEIVPPRGEGEVGSDRGRFFHGHPAPRCLGVTGFNAD